jgi:hypothetical protein
VLAGGAVGHVVVELEAAVELDVNLELFDGELVEAGLLAAAEGGGLGAVLAALSGDDLAALGSVFAGPAPKVEPEVVVERAGD